MASSGFSRTTVKFQNLGKLLEVNASTKFKTIITKMSCLTTMAQMNKELEVSQLIDIVNEFRISNKSLVIFMESLNATLLRKKTITFNVIIHHNKSGECRVMRSRELEVFLGSKELLDIEEMV